MYVWCMSTYLSTYWPRLATGRQASYKSCSSWCRWMKWQVKYILTYLMISCIYNIGFCCSFQTCTLYEWKHGGFVRKRPEQMMWSVDQVDTNTPMPWFNLSKWYNFIPHTYIHSSWQREYHYMVMMMRRRRVRLASLLKVILDVADIAPIIGRKGGREGGRDRYLSSCICRCVRDLTRHTC